MDFKSFVVKIIVVIYLQHLNIGADLKTQTTYTCEDDVLKIECPDQHHIEIAMAMFGRRSRTICLNGEDTTSWDLNCMSTDSLSIVSAQCQGKKSCQLPATKIFFGNACPETRKYLEIEYDCNRDPERPDLIETTPSASSSITQFCPSTSRRRIEWPVSRPGQLVFRPCPNNEEKNAAWQCGWNPVSWVHRPDLSECVSQTVINIENMINNTAKDPGGLLNIISGLASVTLDETELFGGDLSHMAHAMKDTMEQIDVVVFNTSEQDEAVSLEVNQKIVKSSSELMSQKFDESWNDLPPKTQAEVLTNLMSSVETSGFKLARTARSADNFHQIEPNIAVKVLSMNASKDTAPLVFPDESVFDGNKDWLDEGDSLKLTGRTVKGEGTTHVVLVIYKNLNHLLHKNCSNSDAAARSHLNSKLISASIKRDGVEVRDLVDPIVFTLRHSENVNVTQVFCSFWNMFGSEEKGWWSTSGCHVVSSNSTHTTCSCSHLTNFAILMSVSSHDLQDSSLHGFTLTMITYFGCIVSIVCLFMAFISFLLIKSLNTDRDTIHRHLFVTLCLAEIIFLISISPYKTPITCLVVAVILHYCFLAAFMWMGLEGLQLYVMLVEVFDVERSRVLWYYLSAYGIPLVIVASTLAVSPNGYETEKYCWLKVERGFIWAFVGPVCVILMINFVMLLVALRAMHRHSRSPAANWKFKQSGKAAKMGMWIKGAFMLIILLGLTWMFGLLYVNEHSIFMAYLFTIFNSFQGFFIFIFHCLLYDKVIKEYRKVFNRISGLPSSFVNMFSSRSLTHSLSNDKSGNHPRRNKLFKFFSLKRSTSTIRQSSFLQSKNSPTAVDNSYHPTDSGYAEEHIYHEPTEEDPSFYLEPTKIKMNLDDDMTVTKKGKIFCMDEDFSLIEGSVAYTEYLDDNHNQVNQRNAGDQSKVHTFNIEKYRIQTDV